MEGSFSLLRMIAEKVSLFDSQTVVLSCTADMNL